MTAFTSPQSIAIQETVADLWEQRDEIEYLIDGRMALVQVSPVGTAYSPYLDGGGSEMLASHGWNVEAILNLDELLGPQAAVIREVASTQLGVDEECDYDDVISRMQQHPEMDDVQKDMASPDELVERAVAALDRADVDGSWWRSQVGCTRGYELPALDLVNATTGWTAHCFEQLMQPWTWVKDWPTYRPAHT